LNERLIPIFKIITNNPVVYAKYPEITEITDTDARGVLVAARDRIHVGAKLLNHPLSGGVLPGVCPYKSLVITEVMKGAAFQTDYESLRLIEGAFGMLKARPGCFSGYDSKTLEDFQILDLDMLDSALMSIKSRE